MKFSILYNYIIVISIVFLSINCYAQDHSKSNLKIGEEVVHIKAALSKSYAPNDLVVIDQKWNYHGSDYKKLVRNVILEDLYLMLEAAKSDGIQLKIISAYRSYKKQERLYNRAVARHGEHQKTTAKPGYSEHQLGTTIDIGTLDPNTVLEQSFAMTKASKWLQKNAAKYGFFQTYTKENSHITGYIPEPWHYRYLGRSK